VMDWMTLDQWPAAVAPIAVTAPILWAAPSALGVAFRVEQFVTGSIQVKNGNELLHTTKRKEWIPNRAYHLADLVGCTELSFQR